MIGPIDKIVVLCACLVTSATNGAIQHNIQYKPGNHSIEFNSRFDLEKKSLTNYHDTTRLNK